MNTFERIRQIREGQRIVRETVEEKLRFMPRTIERHCGYCGVERDFRILPFGFTGIKDGPDYAAYECTACTTSTFMEIK